jgi:hypothetical protein
MTKLSLDETLLTRTWIFENGKIHGDKVCERIKC